MDINLKKLKDMNEEELEEVLSGKLYVKRLKDELDLLKLDWEKPITLLIVENRSIWFENLFEIFYKLTLIFLI